MRYFASPRRSLDAFPSLLGCLLLAFLFSGCQTTQSSQRPSSPSERSFGEIMPARSQEPIVRTQRLDQKQLLYRIYNTSEASFRALLIFIRAESCKEAPAKRLWTHISTDPLGPQSAQTFRHAMPVPCDGVDIKAVAIRPGNHGKPLADKRFPWLQWRIMDFQAPYVRLMVYNSSKDTAVVFGISVIGFLCATKKIAVQRFLHRRPLLPGQPFIQTLRMNEICEDIRVQIQPLGVMRRKPNQPPPSDPTPTDPNLPPRENHPIPPNTTSPQIPSEI